MTTRAAITPKTAMAIQRPCDTLTFFQVAPRRLDRPQAATAATRAQGVPLGGSGDQLLHLLTAHALRDHRGDAVALHGHAVKRVSDLHRRLLVRDDDDLRLGTQLFEQ